MNITIKGVTKTIRGNTVADNINLELKSGTIWTVRLQWLRENDAYAFNCRSYLTI